MPCWNRCLYRPSLLLLGKFPPLFVRRVVFHRAAKVSGRKQRALTAMARVATDLSFLVEDSGVDRHRHLHHVPCDVFLTFVIAVKLFGNVTIVYSPFRVATVMYSIAG